MGELTEGESLERKSKALSDICGVGAVSALRLKTPEELKALTGKISGVIKEKKERELRENNKPSFKLKIVSSGE